MSIVFDSQRNTLTLLTRRTAYQMRVGSLGHLLHLYYGRRVEGSMDYLYQPHDYGFSPSPYELKESRQWSVDVLPQEYSGANTGDYRLSALRTECASGVWGTDLRYVRHTISPGKYAVTGMPSAFQAADGEAETLSVLLEDAATGLQVELLYGVFADQDVIARAARITNGGKETVRLHQAASLCLDLPFGQWDLLHFHGRHCMERLAERVPLMHGIQTVSSRRGVSSHQHNPFVILCARDAGEDAGECYGVMPVYSGSHRTDVEVDQLGLTRLVSGVHDEQFLWRLAPGETFHTPEVLLSFTHAGLTDLSHTWHRFLRRNVIRTPLKNQPRPVLLNNWEGTYFDFNLEKLTGIARAARDLGVDLLVLDDGWFGARNDDNRGLGDWTVNEEKLPGGLDALIREVNGLGMRFGLWIEPEMVNEDSDLYRAHPDWALTAPGRAPAMCRNQLVLDLARPEVVDWLYETFAGLLTRHNISYIKWDMNRNLSDIYSRALPPERQGEAPHRYMLGLYSLLERLMGAFPEVLFEGCSGGGGRFDAGMLAYFPQIWCSDDTDAIERLEIQRGTSYGYPAATMGAHVSASLNHQTGRRTPLGTRAVVAMSGTFGYELDPRTLSEEERTEIRGQVARFRQYDALVRDGDCYRLDTGNGYFEAWAFVAPDQSEALMNVVVTHPRANTPHVHVRWKGLDPAAEYEVRREFFGNVIPVDVVQKLWGGETRLTGAALMYGGDTLPLLMGDYPSGQIYLKRV